jgi:ribonuclease P protein component
MAGPCWRAAAPGAATSSQSATREPFGTRKPIKPATGGALPFPRSARILRSADFRMVYDNGIRLSSPLFAAFCLARTDSAAGAGVRLGLTVPRALGGAVVRNRIKRRLREAFRMHRSRFGPQWDIVLNPRRAALTAPFPEIERALQRVIEKCGH